MAKDALGHGSDARGEQKEAAEKHAAAEKVHKQRAADATKPGEKEAHKVAAALHGFAKVAAKAGVWSKEHAAAAEEVSRHAHSITDNGTKVPAASGKPPAVAAESKPAEKAEESRTDRDARLFGSPKHKEANTDDEEAKDLSRGAYAASRDANRTEGAGREAAHEHAAEAHLRAAGMTSDKGVRVSHDAYAAAHRAAAASEMARKEPTAENHLAAQAAHKAAFAAHEEANSHHYDAGNYGKAQIHQDDAGSHRAMASVHGVSAKQASSKPEYLGRAN